MSEIDNETVRCTLVEALRLLRSLHADIEAMRDNGEEYYGEFPDYRTNERGVSVEWPNLAIMSDEVGAFLTNRTVRELTTHGRIDAAVREITKNSSHSDMFNVGKVTVVETDLQKIGRKALDEAMREVGKALEARGDGFGYRSEDDQP